MIGNQRHVPDEAADVSDAAKSQGYDERPSGQSQPQGVRQAWNCQRNCADEDSEKDSGKQRNELGLVQLPEGIAEQAGCLLELLLGPDNLEHVAELQAQAGGPRSSLRRRG